MKKSSLMKVLAFIMVIIGAFAMGYISESFSISEYIIGIISFLLAFLGGATLVASLVEKYFFED